ncbi:hypothetical protein M9Y10_031757 [Tritrichomonas musculus]|uniref:Myb-like DNA-binding domain containing protein n=1 Tax=Tritrichomonas musculus TaxID=1915356 RepID=A0ABR2GZQ1_9EUKA
MLELKDYRNKFTKQEDEYLLSLTRRYGPKRWKFIANQIPGKTGRQCRDRYVNYLRDGIGNHPWTEDEDYLLHIKVKEMGTHWSKISQFFKGRSANNIKNRWYTYHLTKKIRFKKNAHKQNNQILYFNMNDYSNFMNNQILQFQQMNQMQNTQNIIHYPNNLSSQTIYSSPPPSYLYTGNAYMNNNNDYFNINNSNKNNIILKNNSDNNLNNIHPNNNCDIKPLLINDITLQNNLFNSNNHRNIINRNINDSQDNIKYGEDKNNLPTAKILDPLKKRIPSIHELLNLNSEF